MKNWLDHDDQSTTLHQSILTSNTKMNLTQRIIALKQSDEIKNQIAALEPSQAEIVVGLYERMQSGPTTGERVAAALERVAAALRNDPAPTADAPKGKAKRKYKPRKPKTDVPATTPAD